MNRTRSVGVLLAAVAALVLAGCTVEQASGDGKAGKFGLPHDIAAKGELQVATYAAFPPLEYKNSAGDIVGAEIDLMKALGEQLGVSVRFTSVPFEQILPGLLSNRYDLAISDMSDTAERRQQVDFVDYATAFTAIVVPKGNPGKVSSLESLCGLPVATQTSSSQYTMLQNLSGKCTADGKPAIKLSGYPGADQVDLAVESGRSYAQVRDYVLGKYQARQSSGKLELVMSGGKPVQVNSPAPVGIAFSKRSSELRDAVAKALQSMIDDGKYAAVLKQHDISDIAIQKVTVNAGESAS